MSKSIAEVCEELKQFDTPTIANALECFESYDRTKGFMDYTIKSVIPCEGTIVGPVATAKIGTRYPATKEEAAKMMPYYEYIYQMGPGCIVVQEDVDDKPFGSFWGEVNASQHLALGCIGVVTNGGVRDLKEVAGLGFGYFAKEVVVTHAYTHVVDFGCDVNVGCCEVHSGDIIACDQHGCILIPKEYLDDIVKACRDIALAELPVLEPCRRKIMAGERISIEELREARNGMAAARKAAHVNK